MTNITERLTQDHIFCISTGMFRQEIVFCYGSDVNELEKKVIEIYKEEYRKKVKKIFKGFRDKRLMGVYHSKKPVRLIYITEQKTLSDFMQVMSHEALHAALEILDYVGIPLGEDSEEAYTYLLGHIVDTIVYNVFEYEGTEEEQIEKELIKDMGLDKKEPSKPSIPEAINHAEAFVEEFYKYKQTSGLTGPL